MLCRAYERAAVVYDRCQVVLFGKSSTQDGADIAGCILRRRAPMGVLASFRSPE